jgi:hypothetical protein
MISVHLGGRIGNHLWMYAVGRTVAESRGLEYHIPRNFLGRDIFKADLGVEHSQVDRIYFEKEGWEQLYDPEIWKVEDNTRIHGWWQTEKYIINNKRNIQQWFTQINPNVNLVNQLLDEDTCVINFRGEDYRGVHFLYLPPQYYHDSINEIRKINPNMKFVVITNDVDEANRFFPGFPAYHFGQKDDMYVVTQARYLIIVNSTFCWWGAWLNNNSKFTIAPKYWFRYNIDNGWWCGNDIITTGWHYMQKSGKLSTSNQCLYEQASQDIKDFPHNQQY